MHHVQCSLYWYNTSTIRALQEDNQVLTNKQLLAQFSRFQAAACRIHSVYWVDIYTLPSASQGKKPSRNRSVAGIKYEPK